MDAVERRKRMLCLLKESHSPLKGSDLAKQFGVSRQVIVQDMAILRASGEKIIATPQGYTMGVLGTKGVENVIACRHSSEQTFDELMSIVSCGGEVVDVIVEHPIYGEITGRLALSTPEDVREFVDRLERTSAKLLSSLTEGIHLHTVRAPGPRIMDQIKAVLKEKGYLLEGSNQ